MTETIKKFISISIWSAITFFVLRCLFGWLELSEVKNSGEYFKMLYTYWGYAGEAIALTTVFMWAFNQWLWKRKPLNILAGKMPVLSKKYKGNITYKDNKKEHSIETKIQIEQTFLFVNVKLYTGESISNSITSNIKDENGTKMLVYTYLNTPKAELQNCSPIHYGTAMLNIDDTSHLTGNYFTSRKSCGSMDFVAVSGNTED